jgi:hypothetical protein
LIKFADSVVGSLIDRNQVITVWSN